MKITILGLSKSCKEIIEENFLTFIRASTDISITFTKDVMLRTSEDHITLLFITGDHNAEIIKILHCDYWRIEIE